MTADQCLELVVTLAGDEHLGTAVSGEVLAGDAHPPELQWSPTVSLGVEARRFARGYLPQLLGPGAVVVPVVRQAEVAFSRSGPVAEQRGQRAVARFERDGRCVTSGRRRRSHELALVAVVGAGYQVVGERQRGQRVRALPRRAEPDGPRVAAVDPEAVVGSFEPAVAEAPEDDVAASAEDGQVRMAVAVDVEGICAGDRHEV